MNRERWMRLQELFEAAVAQAPSERLAYLRESCGGDTELFDEVAALVASDLENSTFLETPAVLVPVQDPAHDTDRPLDATSVFESGGGSPAGEAPDARIEPGRQLGRFTVVSKIGEGGMGEVFLARDRRLQRHVALKILRSGVISTAQARRRFLNEARAASALNHPNIVTIHGVEEASGLDYLVMEHVSGESFTSRIGRGPLEFSELVDVARQLAAAVSAAHQQGIVHRDLKPGNILVTSDGRVKVLDFGLAQRTAWPAPAERAASGDAGVALDATIDSEIAGTIPYMSPEQVQSARVDGRSDLFSLGSVLYEAATGRRPFQGGSPAEILEQILHADPPRPSLIQPGLPPELDPLFERSLAKVPDERFATADELAAALEAVVERVRERAEAARRRPRQRRRRQMALAAAAIVLVVAAVAAVQFRHHTLIARARDQVATLERLSLSGDYAAAFALAESLLKTIPDDPVIQRLQPLFTDELSVTSSPPGAEVYLTQFTPSSGAPSAPRTRIGTTPVANLRIARDSYVLEVVKAGYEPLRRTISSSVLRTEKAIWDRNAASREARLVSFGDERPILVLDARAPLEFAVQLLPSDRVPRGMVFVGGGSHTLGCWGRWTEAGVELDDFFIDRCEVSNGEYQEFVAAAGYARPELWKVPFVENGKTLSWDEGIGRLADRTGKPGPRDWSDERYPAGTENLPVTGVSWYEAMAYAEFRGKRLPTAFQWERAARGAAPVSMLHGNLMPWGVGSTLHSVRGRANFDGRGPVPVTGFEFGMSPYGCLHMAGNVAEWCLNPGVEGYVSAGASWRDPAYLFGCFGDYPPLFASSAHGFRCVVVPDATVPHQGDMPFEPPALAHVEPVPDDEYRAFMSHFRYDTSALDAKVEKAIDAADWRRELISFAGGGGDRGLAYLYLPRHGRKPLQLIHYLPSSASVSGGLTIPQETEVVCGPFIKAGRAVMVVVPEGNVERPWPLGFAAPSADSVRYRDLIVHRIIDQRRSLDYAATRKELDMSRVACLGVSVTRGSIVQTAVEDRYRSVCSIAAGLLAQDKDLLPEVNPLNFVSRIRPPGGTLMINGRYDEALPWRTMGEPFYELLSEPKQLVLLDAGHFPVPAQWLTRVSEWFDTTLGPATAP